ncbi:hypothetical protein [Qipengyuania nanhaisediminis]|uniref:hypothetical protein n=1 Tax=Qipengyuania nanhaisediminis TaxID=604088 RepID=UPI0038B27C10
MTEQPQGECRVEGVKHLGAQADEASVCALFRDVLTEHLGESGPGDDMSVALDITAQGSITARVTDRSGKILTPHDSVSVDIMDRPLELDDVARLAETAAGLMKSV